MSLLLAACTGAPGPAGGTPPGNQSQGTAASAGDGATSSGASATSLVEAASAVTDACTLMPMDLAASIVTNASEPQSQQFPPYKCTVTNDTSVLEITIGAGDTGGAVSGAEEVPGLAAGGYFERLAPGDAYLTVLLSADVGELYVEIVDPSGTDHKDDAIAVAQRVLADLQ